MAGRKGAAAKRAAEKSLRLLTDSTTAQAYLGKTARRYVLRLYTAGSNPRSLRAVETVRQLCSRELKGRAELQVIDLYQQPELAVADRVVAAPCLVRLVPTPRQFFIGDITDRDRLRSWLGIRAVEHGRGKE